MACSGGHLEYNKSKLGKDNPPIIYVQYGFDKCIW